MNDVNTTPTIAEAERLIGDAQRAGADSLATEAITTARLVEARTIYQRLMSAGADRRVEGQASSASSEKTPSLSRMYRANISEPAELAVMSPTGNTERIELQDVQRTAAVRRLLDGTGDK